MKEQEIAVAIMDAVRTIVRALRLNTRAIERELGISLAQLWVLQLLNEHSVESLNELADATATHQSSVSVVVSRLVARGLATRTTAPGDKRRVHIEVTAEGRELFKRAPTTVQARLLGGLQEMPFDRQLRLAALMGKWLTRAGLDLRNEPPMLMEDESGSTATV